MSAPSTPSATESYMKIKDITPNITTTFNLKAIVLEKKVPEKMEDSGNVLMSDETGCINVVLPGRVVSYLNYGDILRLEKTSKLMSSGNRLFVFTNDVTRVGEFTMLFKESFNVSRLAWTKDPASSQWTVVVDNANKRKK